MFQDQEESFIIKDLIDIDKDRLAYILFIISMNTNLSEIATISIDEEARRMFAEVNKAEWNKIVRSNLNKHRDLVFRSLCREYGTGKSHFFGLGDCNFLRCRQCL